MIKRFLLKIEEIVWNIRCRYGFWLHGPYGLANVIDKIPFHFLVKYLRKYGATVGDGCRFERGINIHRAFGKQPFENLIIGKNVYLGHNTLIDLTRKVIIKDRVIIASGCQIWTHASFYDLQGSYSEPKYYERYGRVIINEGAIIYSGTIISYGVTIGSFSRVAACSLVTKNIEPGSLVGGVPARPIK